jgi:hypothetical protein
MPELLRIDKLSAGYGEAVVLHDISPSAKGKRWRCWAATAPERQR